MRNIKELFKSVGTRLIWSYVAAGSLWFVIDDYFIHAVTGQRALARVHSIESVIFLATTTVFLSLLIRRYSKRIDAAEQSLLDANSKLSAVIRSSPVAIVTMDLEGKIVSWNPAAEKIFGWREEELIGCPLPTVPEDREEECRAHRGIVMSGNSFSDVEARRRKKDGMLVDVALSAAPIFNHVGTIIGLMTVMADTSGRKHAEQALRWSEDRFRYILKHNPNAMAVLDKDLHYIMVSDRYLQDYKIHEKDVIGRNHYDVFPELPEKWKHVHQKTLRGDVERCEEDTFPRADGSIDYNRWECRPWWDSKGEIGGIIIYSEVITERKIAEKALRDVQLQQKAMIDNIPDIAWMKDRESKFVMVNDAFGRSCGKSCEAIIGTTDFDIWPRELAQKYRLDDKEVMAGGIKKVIEEPVVHHDGLEGAFETIKIPLYDADGTVIGTTGIARDITERKKMEEALRESEERFRQVFQQSPIGMTLISLQGKPVASNAAFQKLLGYEEDELFDLRFEDFTHVDDVSAGILMESKLLSGETSNYQMEKRYITKTGDVVWVRLTASLMRTSSGHPRYAIAMVEDITQRRMAEEALILHQEQLSSLASELSLAEERERRKVATILHDDIGQTLAFARMRLDDAANGEGVAEVSNILKKAIEEVRSLTFQLSPPLLYEVGFKAAVEWLAETFSSRHGFAVVVTDDGKQNLLPEELSVTLFQIVRELLANVSKHSRAQRVVITLESIGAAVQIGVVDDGIGFDSSIRNRKPNSFGLFSIRQRIEHLGGSFHLASQRGKGTSVMLTVPIKQRKKNKKRSVYECSACGRPSHRTGRLAPPA